MSVLFHWLHVISSVWLLACGLVGAASEASDLKTGIAEFDLVFPRNETYAPSIVFPAAVALQSPAVARSMNPSLYYYLNKKNGSYWEVVDSGKADISGLVNASDSEPLFIHQAFGKTFDIEASWFITWKLLWLNCFEQGAKIQSQGNVTYGRVYFTTKKGGIQPDLRAATESYACLKSAAQTFNVTNVVEAPYDPGAVSPVESCAVYSHVTPIWQSHALSR